MRTLLYIFTTLAKRLSHRVAKARVKLWYIDANGYRNVRDRAKQTEKETDIEQGFEIRVIAATN